MGRHNLERISPNHTGLCHSSLAHKLTGFVYGTGVRRTSGDTALAVPLLLSLV